MTIHQALVFLEELRDKYGSHVEVFFDCPKCGISFKPDRVVATSIHLQTSEKK